MDQAFDPLLELGKGPKVHQLGDRDLDELVWVVLLLDQSPRVGLQALQAEADAPPLAVHAEDVDVDLLPHLHHIARLLHPVPGHL